MNFDEFVQAATANAQARIVKEGGELQALLIGPDPWSVCWTFRRVFVRIERKQTGQIVDYTLFKKAEPSEVSGGGRPPVAIKLDEYHVAVVVDSLLSP